MRILLAGCAAAVVALGSPGAAGAQQGWVVRSSAQADLWFHGMAVVGFEGFTPLPLYDRSYADEVRRAKEAAGVFPTALDEIADRLQAEFERDSVFEVLHFVPLYFPAASPEEMLDALRSVAAGEPPDQPVVETMFGMNAVGAVLRSERQRRVLGDLVDALEEEWNVFLRARLAGRSDAAREATQRRWDSDVGPAVAGFRRQVRLASGVLMISPSLGPDGRIFAGDPRDDGDNVVAVSSVIGPEGAAALLAVRELCFPTVSALVQRMDVGGGNRVAAELTSSRAAVRCGNLLLEAADPGLAAEYRGAFLQALGQQGTDRGLFEAMYPADEELLEDLTRAIGIP